MISQINVNKLFNFSDSDLASCVGWTGNNELFSIGDDKKIMLWSGEGDFLSLVNTFDPTQNDDVYVTDMQWLPVAPGSKQFSDVYCVAATDGV